MVNHPHPQYVRIIHVTSPKPVCLTGRQNVRFLSVSGQCLILSSLVKFSPGISGTITSQPLTKTVLEIARRENFVN